MLLLDFWRVICFLCGLIMAGSLFGVAQADMARVQQEESPQAAPKNQNPPPFVPNLPEDEERYLPSPPADEPSLWDDLRRFFRGEEGQQQETPPPETLELGPGCVIDEESLEKFYEQYEMM